MHVRGDWHVIKWWVQGKMRCIMKIIDPGDDTVIHFHDAHKLQVWPGVYAWISLKRFCYWSSWRICSFPSAMLCLCVNSASYWTLKHKCYHTSHGSPQAMLWDFKCQKFQSGRGSPRPNFLLWESFQIKNVLSSYPETFFFVNSSQA